MRKRAGAEVCHSAAPAVGAVDASASLHSYGQPAAGIHHDRGRGGGRALVCRLFNFDRAISMKSELQPAACGCSGSVSASRSSPVPSRAGSSPRCGRWRAVDGETERPVGSHEHPHPGTDETGLRLPQPRSPHRDGHAHPRRPLSALGTLPGRN